MLDVEEEGEAGANTTKRIPNILLAQLGQVLISKAALSHHTKFGGGFVCQIKAALWYFLVFHVV